MMILKLALCGLLGTTVMLWANGEALGGTGAMAVLAGVIVWMVRGDREMVTKSVEAMVRSAKASENLAAILAERPCYLDSKRRRAFLEVLQRESTEITERPAG